MTRRSNRLYGTSVHEESMKGQGKATKKLASHYDVDQRLSLTHLSLRSLPSVLDDCGVSLGVSRVFTSNAPQDHLDTLGSGN